MDVFVNDNVFKENYPVAVNFGEDKMRLSIIDLIDYPDLKKSEMFEFELPFIHNPRFIFERNLCLSVSNVGIQGNKYIFEKGRDSTNNSIYALIRPGIFTEPGECYIPVENCEKIEVIKQFKFCGHGALGEKFLDRIYFLKICLSTEEEFFPIYMSTKETDRLKQYVNLFKSDCELKAINRDTSISLFSYEARKKYIALSEL